MPEAPFPWSQNNQGLLLVRPSYSVSVGVSPFASQIHCWYIFNKFYDHFDIIVSSKVGNLGAAEEVPSVTLSNT